MRGTGSSGLEENPEQEDANEGELNNFLLFFFSHFCFKCSFFSVRTFILYFCNLIILFTSCAGDGFGTGASALEGNQEIRDAEKEGADDYLIFYILNICRLGHSHIYVYKCIFIYIYIYIKIHLYTYI